MTSNESDDDKLSPEALARIRRQPTPKELDRLVDNQIEELVSGGKLYKFRTEHRCRICQDTPLRTTVNKLLAHGLSYKEILEAISAVNDSRPKSKRISLDSIRNHSKKHFPIDEPAGHVFRKILEEEADKQQKDWVGGIGSQITLYAYLKTMESKGYATLTDPETPISAVEGMNASIKLHELIKAESDTAQIAEVYQKLNTVIQVVKKVVPQEDWARIIAAIEAAEAGVIDVEVMDVEEQQPRVGGIDPDLLDALGEDPSQY